MRTTFPSLTSTAQGEGAEDAAAQTKRLDTVLSTLVFGLVDSFSFAATSYPL